MDCLTFISKIVDSLVWPITAIVLVIFLKDEIKKVVPFIRKFKAGPLEAEFEHSIEKLRDSVPESVNTETPDTASKAFLIQLSTLHPRSAITESWIRLEAAARTVLSAKSESYSKSPYMTAARLAKPLKEIDALNEAQLDLFHELRRLRNDVAHEKVLELNLESARSFIDLASSLQGYLEGQT